MALSFDLADEPKKLLPNLWWWFKRWFTLQPHRKIFGDSYMHRWYVIPRNRWWNVYLHRYFGPDKGTDPHDHPWNSLSIMLWGGFTEEERSFYGWHMINRTPGEVVYRPAEHLHRILTVKPGKTWTLFVTFKYKRKWGFLMRQADGSYQWVAYDDPSRKKAA